MHPDNDFYGHRSVLLEYAGLVAGERVFAHIQHGWHHGTGISVGPRLVPWLPKLLWSSRNERECARLGIEHGRAIGAPFVYAATSEQSGTASPAGTIFYPFHGWARATAVGSHDDLVDEIAEREPGPVTICLYHLEAGNERIRRPYEEKGFRITSHGDRDGNPRFLHDQITELRRHRRVATNRVSTALFYGAHLGLEPAVYGPWFALRGEDRSVETEHRRLLPELFDESASLADVRAVADRELGADLRLSPAELKRALGVDGGRLWREQRRARVQASFQIRRLWANRPGWLR